LPCKRKDYSEPPELWRLPDEKQCCTQGLGPSARERRDLGLGMGKGGRSWGLSKGE